MVLTWNNQSFGHVNNKMGDRRMSVTKHGPPPMFYEQDGVALPSKVDKAAFADPDEEEQKKNYIVELIQEYADNGTAHGIPRVIGSHYVIAKIFWMLLVFGLAGVFIWQGKGLILDYIGAPYNTKIDIISKTEVDFPAVTVCNMNRMKRSRLIDTRFQGIVDVDGGFDLESGDYAWFFDFSSAFYEDFYSDWDWDPTAAPGGAPGRRRRAVSSPTMPPPSPTPGAGAGTSGAPGTSPPPGGSPPAPTSPAGGSPAPGGSSPPPMGGSSPVPSSPFGGVSGPPMGVSGAPPGFPGGSSAVSPPGGSSIGAPPFPGGGSYGAYGPSSGDQYVPWWEAENEWLDDFEDFDFEEFDSFAFEYDNYYDWDVEGESDWDGFYSQSKSADFSDIADIANPTKQELKDYGHQAEDFILQCTFDKRGCNYTDFFQFQNSAYGNCYTFNHGLENTTVRKTSKSGAQYGLHLTLFIEQPEYVGIFSPESGVRVSIHDAAVKPTPEDIGITATTGMATSIGMRQFKISRLGGAYSVCTDGSDLAYDDPVFSYSTLACRKGCLQKEMADSCGCVTDILDLDIPKCSYINSTQQRCKQLVETLYNDDKLECNCPDPCEEIKYPTSVSSALWPSEKYSQHLYARVAEVNDKAARTLQDYETTRKNVVRLRIFFEELNYQLMEQQPVWSIEGISGSVGGLMGLYLGISAISFVEIILFILKVLIYILTCGHVCIRNMKVHP